MTLTVSVSTADGVPIQDGVRIAVNGGPSNMADKGQFALGMPNTWPINLTVSVQKYNTQSVSIGLAGSGSPIWDDPGSIVSKSGQDLTAEVRLGRMKSALTKPWGTPIQGLEYIDSNIAITKDIVESFGKDTLNKKFFLPLQHTFTRPDGQYAFLYSGRTRFYAATSPQLLGNKEGEEGWNCFSAQSSDIDPLTEGHFTLVEWTSPEADSQGPRYLVALWRPRSVALDTVSDRDVIVFYTPETAWAPEKPKLFFPPDKPPYRGYYPYAANQRGLDGSGINPQLLAQRYIELALRYLFNERNLVFDILAAKRDALVVVPICCPNANWARFAELAGLQRALSEAILFERRAQDDPTKGSLDVAPAQTFRIMRSYSAPPSLGTVAVAGTSGGLGPVKSLLQAASLPPVAGSYSMKSVEDFYRSDPARLYSSWREVWDFEGYPGDGMDNGRWARTLMLWQQASGHYQGGVTDRIIRIYHAEYTHWGVQDLELLRPSLGGKSVQTLQRTSKNGGRARELEGPTGTAVWFSKQFLERNGPASDWNASGQPAFWTGDQHHVVSTICLAHAAALSGLQKI